MDVKDSLAEALADGICPECGEHYMAIRMIEAFDGPEPGECEWCAWLRAVHYARKGEEPRIHRIVLTCITREEWEERGRPEFFEVVSSPLKRPGTKAED